MAYSIKAEIEQTSSDRGRLVINADIVLEHSLSVLERILSGRFPEIPKKGQPHHKALRIQYLPYTGPEKIPQNLAYALMTEHPAVYLHRDFANGFKPLSRKDAVDIEKNKIKSAETLTREEERKMFKSLNYHKKRLHESAKSILDNESRSCAYTKEMKRMLKSYEEVISFLETISKLNMGLAFIVRKRLPNVLDEEEIESISMATLSYAADRFDFNRGNKFSTYVYNAIMLRTIRADKKVRREINMDSNFLESLKMTAENREKDESPYADSMRIVIKRNLAALNKREKTVIHGRFFSGETFQTIGDRIGITKEGVRQIEKRAKEKIGRAFNEFCLRKFGETLARR